MLQIQRIQKRVQGLKREGFEGARIQMKYTFCHREAEWNEAVAIWLFNAKKGEIALKQEGRSEAVLYHYKTHGLKMLIIGKCLFYL